VKALLFNGFFVVLWLVSGAFFRAAAKGDAISR
jgi:type IV secretory pathway TrbD component